MAGAAGADVISVSGFGSGSSLLGGAGVDSITFSGDVSDLGTLEFGSFTDSTVSAFDTVDFDDAVSISGGAAPVSGLVTMDFAAISAGVLGSARASFSTLGDLANGASGSFTTGL